jgi:hypothetical protein
MTETRANQSRTASSKEQTRSNDERKKTWTPPDILGAPEPRDGYQHRWVRKDLLGKDEAQNVIKRARQHYEPVRADAHPDYLSVAAEDGKHDGIIMNGDLMLMEVPIDVADQRRTYYDDKADGLQRSVDSELKSEDNALMPIHQSRKSKTDFGNPDREVSFQKDANQED